MTSSVPAGQTDVDDWFDLDKYRQAAGVAYEFSKKKAEDVGSQERETIGKGAEEQRTSAEQGQQFKQSDEARDYGQAQRSLTDVHSSTCAMVPRNSRCMPAIRATP